MIQIIERKEAAAMTHPQFTRDGCRNRFAVFRNDQRNIVMTGKMVQIGKVMKRRTIATLREIAQCADPRWVSLTGICGRITIIGWI